MTFRCENSKVGCIQNVNCDPDESLYTVITNDEKEHISMAMISAVKLVAQFRNGAIAQSNKPFHIESPVHRTCIHAKLSNIQYVITRIQWTN